MAKTKDDQPDVTSGDDLDTIDTATPAADVRLVVGQKVTFETPGGSDVSLGTIAGFDSDGVPLVQWNGQEATIPVAQLTVQP